MTEDIETPAREAAIRIIRNAAIRALAKPKETGMSNPITLRFSLIASKAAYMAQMRTRPYAQDIYQAVSEIQKLCREIDQEARQYDAGDR